MQLITIGQMIADATAKFADNNALGRRDGENYRYLTYSDLGSRSAAIAIGLHELGLVTGDRIALLSESRPEWALLDLGAQLAGLVTVPIYPSLPGAQIKHILNDSGSVAIVVSDFAQLQKISDIREDLVYLKHVILMSETLKSAPEIGNLMLKRFNDLLSVQAPPLSDYPAYPGISQISPFDIATLIYTSGTTGEPKGVMLSHQHLLATGYAACQIIDIGPTDTFLSFLPPCHIFERAGGYYLPLSVGASIVYSEGAFAIADELTRIQPTIMLCVPRLFEAMHERIMEKATKAPLIHRKLFQWAIKAAQPGNRESRITAPPYSAKRSPIQRVAEEWVLAGVRKKVAGGKLRYFVSGGAPLNPATARFWIAIGVPILEGYGLTEFPVVSVNRPGDIRIGTVGPPMPGVEVMLAEDGEIYVRGDCEMRGYYNQPEASADTIDADGWFHTGDIGSIENGSIRITDRKKDILVLANGKNVAPQPIEAKLKQSPFIAEAVLFGDGENQVVALLVPVFERLHGWAKEHRIEFHHDDDLVANPAVRRLYKQEISRQCRDLADFEKPKRFDLLDHPLSVDSGELTPTLKVRRKQIAEKYREKLQVLSH